MNKLKTKVNDLDVDKLKTVPINLKKLNDVISKKVVKKTKYNKLNMKVNSLENKVPDISTWIYINEYNTDKQGLEKKIKDFDRKILDVSNLISNTTLKTNIDEINKKIPDVSDLVTNTALNAKIDEVENRIPDYAKYISTPEFTKFADKIFDTKLKLLI